MSKIFVVILVIVIATAGIASAQRLPVVGSDNNVWGDLINHFLNVSHHQNGSIRLSTNMTVNDTETINIGNLTHQLQAVYTKDVYLDGSPITLSSNVMSWLYDGTQFFPNTTALINITVNSGNSIITNGAIVTNQIVSNTTDENFIDMFSVNGGLGFSVSDLLLLELTTDRIFVFEDWLPGVTETFDLGTSEFRWNVINALNLTVDGINLSGNISSGAMLAGTIFAESVSDGTKTILIADIASLALNETIRSNNWSFNSTTIVHNLTFPNNIRILSLNQTIGGTLDRNTFMGYNLTLRHGLGGRADDTHLIGNNISAFGSNCYVFGYGITGTYDDCLIHAIRGKIGISSFNNTLRGIDVSIGDGASNNVVDAIRGSIGNGVQSSRITGIDVFVNQDDTWNVSYNHSIRKFLSVMDDLYIFNDIYLGDASQAHITADDDELTVEMENSKLILYNAPSAGNDFKVFEIFSKEAQDVTEFIIHKAGPGRSALFSRSLRVGGGSGRNCTQLTGTVDCDVGLTGADFVLEDEIWTGGGAYFGNESFNISDNGDINMSGSIRFLNKSLTVAGIENQNLLDKTDNEIITGNWSFKNLEATCITDYYEIEFSNNGGLTSNNFWTLEAGINFDANYGRPIATKGVITGAILVSDLAPSCVTHQVIQVRHNNTEFIRINTSNGARIWINNTEKSVEPTDFISVFTQPFATCASEIDDPILILSVERRC